jgi:hypothetical protein
MFRSVIKLVSCVLTLAVILATGQVAIAQSTIFNIPSTDVVGVGSVYLEFDYFGQMPKPDEGDRLNIFVPRVVTGLAPNVEVGANVAFIRSGGTTNSFFQPNIKWKFAAVDDKGVAGSAGAVLYTPMNNREGVDTYGLVYGNFSKKVQSTYGPRFTVGPYGIVSGGDSFVGPKGGVILGYEQPLHAKASFVADWLSGKNGFGYFTPGVSFTLPRSLLNIGYSIGNDSYDENDTNRLLFIYYGITF